MIELLVIKERIKKAYSTHGKFVDSAAKGLMMLISCMAINTAIGYMSLLQSPFIVLLLAVIAALLPASALILLLSIVIIGNLFYVTMEAALVLAVLLVIFFLVYFAFKPKNSYIMAVTIMLGTLQFFGPIPVIVGLMFTPAALCPMTFGLIVSQYIAYISNNYVLLGSNTSTLSNLQKVTQIVTGVFLDESLWIMLVILVLVSLVIYAVRRMQFRSCWPLAIGIGAGMLFLLTLLSDIIFETGENYIVLAINLVLEILVGTVLCFLFFMVDYSREENVQFEDDEYYYYVKAVPKITVTVPEIKVTRIREKNVKETSKALGQVTFVRDSSGEDKLDVKEEEDD